MDLIIDATGLRSDRTTGLERFTQEIVKHLSLSSLESDIRLNILVRKDFNIYLHWCEGFQKNITLYHSPIGNKILTHLVWLPLKSFQLLLNKRTEVAFLFPALPPPISMAYLFFIRPRLYRVIHDTAAWTYPQHINASYRIYHKRCEEFFMSSYSVLFTVSNTSAQMISSIFGRSVDDIHVVYNGVDHIVELARSITSDVQVNTAITQSPFFLSVGTVEPRKNYMALIQAYMGLSAAVRSSLPVLVIVGRLGWGYESLQRTIYENNLTDNVKLIGSVSDESLSALYSAALACLFPSHDEGFCIPVVEGLLLNGRVFTSNIPVFKELYNNLVGFVGLGEHYSDWTSLILALSQDLRLSSRSQDLSSGRAIASVLLDKYSWHASSKIILEEINAKE